MISWYVLDIRKIDRTLPQFLYVETALHPNIISVIRSNIHFTWRIAGNCIFGLLTWEYTSHARLNLGTLSRHENISVLQVYNKYIWEQSLSDLS